MLEIIRISLALFIISFFIPQIKSKDNLIGKLLSTGIFLHYGETIFAVLVADLISMILFLLLTIYAGI